jgi:hypothetical protein
MLLWIILLKPDGVSNKHNACDNRADGKPNMFKKKEEIDMTEKRDDTSATSPDADGTAALIADAPAMLDALRELVDFAEVDKHHRYHGRSKAAFDRAYEILKRHGG